MAKRKAAAGAGKAARKTKKKAAAARSRPAARKAAARKTGRAARAGRARTARKASRASGSTKTVQAAQSRTTTRSSTTAKKNTRGKAAQPPKSAARNPAKAAARSRQRAERGGGRKAPALNRERRTIQGDEIVPTPPSSLDLDRSASAVRSGRQALRERLDQHNETGPAMTAGDVDADWESAYSVGDEAPGGDNPTPDQDVVDDIGRAVGVQYDDNEELKGEAKITKRDKHRWELDPASSEDCDER
jgi:hypothetical protein